MREPAKFAGSFGCADDTLGRTVSETGTFGTVAYQYDLAGRRTRLSWPGSALYVDYDHLVTGEVSAIRENGATTGAGVLGIYAYDDLGRRTGLTRGNGATTSWSYDNVSRLTGLSHNLAGTASDVTFAYAYDPAGGIVSTTRDNDAYAYTGLANANVTNTVNGLNQVTAAGGSSLSYDARGNVIAVPAAASPTGAAATYDYYAENGLVHGPGGSAFIPDPLGRLFVSYAPAPGATYYLMDGQTIVAELDSGSNVTRRYVPGPGTDEPLVWYEGSGTSTRRYHHADERGSVIAVSDGSGALVGSAPNRYDEYGNAQGTLTGRFGYTGQLWLPEAGLYHYRARAYNPAMGRFMQTDPIGFGGGMNPYAYVGNNPVNFTDPMGLGPRPCVVVSNGSQSEPPTERCGDDWPSTGGANIWSRGGTGSPTDGGGNPGVNGCAPGEISDNCVSVTGPQSPPPEDFEPPTARDLWMLASAQHNEDTCTGVPERPAGGGDFTQACRNHDRCYQTLGMPRLICDHMFLNDMVRVCRGASPQSRCLPNALAYYNGIRALGLPAYILEQLGGLGSFILRILGGR